MVCLIPLILISGAESPPVFYGQLVTGFSEPFPVSVLQLFLFSQLVNYSVPIFTDRRFPGFLNLLPGLADKTFSRMVKIQFREKIGII